MTDARLPSHWLYDPDLDALSDRAWRTLTGSLMWSNDQGTDGLLPTHCLRFLYAEGVDDATAEELIGAGKWKRMPTGFLVTDWKRTQSLAADVEKQRERNRLKQQAYRDRQSGDNQVVTSTPDQGVVTGDVTGNATSNAGGQDRQGKDAVTEPEFYETSGAKTAADAAREFNCYECQRRSAFKDQPPCPDHREAS